MSSDGAEAPAARRPFGRHNAAAASALQPLQPQAALDSQQPYASAQPHHAERAVNDAAASMQQLQLQSQSLWQQPPPSLPQAPPPQSHPSYDHAAQQHMLAAHSYPAASPSSGTGPSALHASPPLPLPLPSPSDPDGPDQSHDPSAPSLEAQPATLGTDGLSWMAASSMQSAPVTVYYSRDPIANLQIRVLLRRQPEEAASLTNPRTLKQLNLALKDKERRDALAAEEATRRAAEEGNTSGAAAARAARSSAARIDEGDEAAPDAPSHSPRGSDGRRILSPDPHEAGAAAFAPSVVVTQLFAWQQKVPSPAEIMLAAGGAPGASSYADQVRHMLRARDPSLASSTDPGALVHAAQQLLAEAPDGMVLSSKRDHDRYVDPDDLHRRVLLSNSGPPPLNPLAARVVMAPLASRRGDSHLTREGGGTATPFHILATVDLPRGDPARIRLVNPAADELDTHPPRILGSFQKPLAALKVRESLSGSSGSSGVGGLGVGSVADLGQVTLEMRPPFSPPQKDPLRFDDAEWYSFSTPAGEVYRYRLENYSALQEGDREGAALAATPASSGAKSHSRSYIAIEESRLAAEAARLSAHEMSLKVRRSGREFDRGPPAGYETWHVYGEIVKLTDFDEEDLSVAYEVDLRGSATGGAGGLSSSWSASVDSVLQAVSQRSQALLARHPVAGKPDRREVYLAFPIELKLRAKTGPYLPPVLYFQVNATNRWGMSGVVGYAFAHLPSTPGSHELQLETWVPVGTLRDQKTSFFVGAGPALRDMKMCGVPLAEEGGPGSASASAFGFGFGTGRQPAASPAQPSRPGVLNRYGWECRGTGTLHLRLEMVQLVAAAPSPHDPGAAGPQHRALAHTNLREQIIAQAMGAGGAGSGGSHSTRDSNRERDELHALRQSTLTQRSSARR